MNLSPNALRRRVLMIAISLFLSAPISQMTAPPAHADDGCKGGIMCSSTKNLSVFPVEVAKKWCNGKKGPCDKSDEGQEFRRLRPGEETPLLEDWDAFRIDRNWCYSYMILPTRFPIREHGEKWVQVHGYERAIIMGQARVPSWLCI